MSPDVEVVLELEVAFELVVAALVVEPVAEVLLVVAGEPVVPEVVLAAPVVALPKVVALLV